MKQKLIKIDEFGFLAVPDGPIDVKELGKWLLLLRRDENGSFSLQRDPDIDDPITIEAFDQIWIGQELIPGDDFWQIRLHYGVTGQFRPQTLWTDNWDRVHGTSDQGIPFVLSRACQSAFFSQLDALEDDGFVWKNQSYALPELYPPQSSPSMNWNFPSDIPDSITKLCAKLKLSKCRILLLDTAQSSQALGEWLREQGHITQSIAVDASSTTFGLQANRREQFDLLIDLSCFDQTPPENRKKYFSWARSFLAHQGCLMLLSLLNSRQNSPPFGGSEWELRQLSKNQFRALYWQRPEASTPDRVGLESLLYLQKLPSFS